MASIGHIAIGMAAARLARHTPRRFDAADKPQAIPPYCPSMVAWSALSLLPDADVIGFPWVCATRIGGAIAAPPTR
jgi:hypothetical protein